MEKITSRRNPIVTRMRRLVRGRTPGDDLILLDGPHMVRAALDAGVVVDMALVEARHGGLATSEIDSLAVALRAAGARCLLATPDVLAAVSPVRTPAGIVGLARLPRWTLEAALRPPPSLLLVAVDVQDPGNLGALIRAADAAGATGVAVAGSSADPFGWKALRGSMGSALRLPVVREQHAAGLLSRLDARGVQLLAADAHAPADLYAQDLRPPTAVLFGSEGAGLPPALLQRVTGRLAIPMRHGVESLNVATAAAVVAYEARRQRSAPPVSGS